MLVFLRTTNAEATVIRQAKKEGVMNKNNDHAATGARLGIGRSMVFSLWASGELGSVTIGRKRFSTDRQIDEYLARLEKAQRTGGDAA